MLDTITIRINAEDIHSLRPKKESVSTSYEPFDFTPFSSDSTLNNMFDVCEPEIIPHIALTDGLTLLNLPVNDFTVTVRGKEFHYQNYEINRIKGKYRPLRQYHMSGWIINIHGIIDAYTGVSRILYLTVTGSLLKWYRNYVGNLTSAPVDVKPLFTAIENNQDKICELTFDETCTALDVLSEVLGFDIKEGYLQRIDIGLNIETKCQPRAYYTRMLKYKDYYGRIQNNGLYLGDKYGCKEQVCFYDKGKEGGHGGNILRYEYRLLDTASIKNKFRRKVMVRDLYSCDFLIKLLEWWNNIYHLIEKYYELISFEGIESQKDLDMRCRATLVSTPEKYSYIEQCIKQSRKDGIIKSDATANNIKKSFIRALEYCREKAPNGDLIQELDLLVDKKYDDYKEHLMKEFDKHTKVLKGPTSSFPLFNLPEHS